MFPFGVSFTNEVEVPLPEPFPGVEEPAFARLMFVDNCTVRLVPAQFGRTSEPDVLCSSPVQIP